MGHSGRSVGHRVTRFECASLSVRPSLTGAIDDEVFGLQVPVGNPLLVYVRESFHNYCTVEHNMVEWQT